MSPDWNCQWGPFWAPIAYTRAMSEHRCFPKKRLSTHTMHFKWHHRNLSINDHESLETNHEWWHTFIINTKKIKIPQNTKIFIWQPRRNMISPVIFAGALTISAGALPPWAPPWWRADFIYGVKMQFRMFNNFPLSRSQGQCQGYGSKNLFSFVVVHILLTTKLLTCHSLSARHRRMHKNSSQE